MKDCTLRRSSRLRSWLVRVAQAGQFALIVISGAIVVDLTLPLHLSGTAVVDAQSTGTLRRESQTRPAPVQLTAANRNGGLTGPRPDAPTQNDVIDEVDFEDFTFPPEGWGVDDQLTIVTHPSPVDTWSRQVCNTEFGIGGQAAAWVAGGGSEGENLSCGQDIGKPISTRLFLDGINTTSYPLGLQVDFHIWLDVPQGSEAFNVCWRESGSTWAGDCFYINPSASQQQRWLGLQRPLQFPNAGGKASVEIMFWFQDRDGTGLYAGGFVDNVRIEGITEAPPPSGTPTPTATATSVVPVIPPTSLPFHYSAYLPVAYHQIPPPTATPALTATNTPTSAAIVPTVTPLPSPTGLKPGWDTIEFQDFEGDFPTGLWHLNQTSEAGSFTWAPRECNPHSGMRSAWCVGGGSDGEALKCQEDYPNETKTQLLYGPFDLSDAVDAEVEFWTWSETQYESDTIYWGASANGLFFAGSRESGVSRDSWKEETLDLSCVSSECISFIGNEEVWIMFSFESDEYFAYQGWFLDDIRISKKPRTAERAPVLNTQHIHSTSHRALLAKEDAVILLKPRE